MSIRTAFTAAVESTEQPADYTTVDEAFKQTLNQAVHSTQRETIDETVVTTQWATEYETIEQALHPAYGQA